MSSTASAPRFDRSIVEGPLPRAVWKLAWPTMLQNIIGGLQGIVDHLMVGHQVGFTGNAAIGVSWQIFLVVMVFISSLFTGMSILVARYAGADDRASADRAVYQGFLTAAGISLGILAPLGYFLSPTLLGFINAAPEVQVEALGYLRIMFVFSFGMMAFFLVGGALRSAGDARTPLRWGIALTILNISLNAILIRGLGPIPALGTTGAALGTVIAGGVISLLALHRLIHGKLVIGFPRGVGWGPDWKIIKALFRFGVPTGLQGIAMNLGGVFLIRFIGSLPESAAAQAAWAISYTELFSLITWTSVGLMGATAAVSGQNLGARQPERVVQAVRIASRIGIAGAIIIGLVFLIFPRLLLAAFGMNDTSVVEIAVQLLRFLSVSGLFITVALVYTGGLQGTGDTRGPFLISLVSQLLVPLSICAVLDSQGLLTTERIWTAVLLGHLTRCLLTVWRFRHGAWRRIQIDLEPTHSTGT